MQGSVLHFRSGARIDSIYVHAVFSLGNIFWEITGNNFSVSKENFVLFFFRRTNTLVCILVIQKTVYSFPSLLSRLKNYFFCSSLSLLALSLTQSALGFDAHPLMNLARLIRHIYLQLSCLSPAPISLPL